MRIYLLSIALVFTLSLNAQSGIRFMTGGLNGIKSIAKEQNKNILIDTYASWCIPCKRMDKVFKQHKVSQFFNANYINYKVDMDGPYGQDMKNEYEVVFLPTLIILGPDGTVKYKVDREMSGEELLTVAELALQDGIQIASDATAIQRNGEAPQKRRRTARPSTPTNKTSGDIVYIMGLDGLEDNSKYLKEEAYLHLELMDGGHTKAAVNYLQTQKNWDTEENMRFILDFVNVPNSPMYDHIIRNKSRYQDLFGKSQVDNSLQILVYKHLYKGIPRPDMDGAVKLFSDLEFLQPEKHAKKYFMTRYRVDREHAKALETALDYFSVVDPHNAKELDVFLEYTLSTAHNHNTSQLESFAKLASNMNIDVEEKIRLQIKSVLLLQKIKSCTAAKALLDEAKRGAEAASIVDPDLENFTLNCQA